MRPSIVALGAAGALALAAIIGGGVYLTRGSSEPNAVRMTGPASQAPASATAAGSSAAPVPLPPRPASAPPLQVPQPVAEAFGDWRVHCELDVQSRESCRAEHALKDENGRVQLAVVAYPANGNSTARLRILPPWGVLIEAGVAVRVDAQPPTPAPITTCFPSGCVAELILSDNLLQAMRGGTEMMVGVMTAERKTVSTRVPLAGFADAYARISRPAVK